VLTIPSLGPKKPCVSRACQIEIKNVFKLVITGIAKYSGLSPRLNWWMRSHFTDGSETLFWQSRIPVHEPNCFIFCMHNWEFTAMVLHAEDKFYQKFSWAKNITAPKLLWLLNNKGVWKKDIHSVFQQGANSVNDRLTALNWRLDNIECNAKIQAEVVQCQLTNITTNVSLLMANIDRIGTQITNNQ
jgi:hypothetical protein